MPELAAFRGLRYDARAVPNLSTVLCPPYDVISASERVTLAARDPRNAVHVELPVADTDAGSPYEAAARIFHGWIADGTLRRDDRPLLYVYEQRYTLPGGAERSARGLFCRLRLEPFGPGSGVRAHEATMSGPKEDRFQLLSAVEANLSPVLLLYDAGDHGRRSASLLEELTAGPPEAEGTGPGGLVNRLWLADPDHSPSAHELASLAGALPLTIADGHHRYETALRYRDQAGAAEHADHVLALLYDASSGGLSLLPWHRVLHAAMPGADLLREAARWFSVEPIATADELVRRLAQSSPGSSGKAFGLWTRAGGAVLEVDRANVARLPPESTSDTLRWLDVSVLSSTLSAMIGSPSAELAAEGRLSYVSDASEAVALVEGGRADACFLLRPTPIEAVVKVAAAGEHMPAKSTFFHPKAATGLVFNPLD